MIALIQRVTQASVKVKRETIGSIDKGLLVLVGVEKTDTPASVDRILGKILGYRVFADSDGKMNLSLQDVEGGLLLVPQFTLAADTTKGLRPGFSLAASPETGEMLFNLLAEQAIKRYSRVALGRFGADMQVELINDGPVTFWLQ